ncbi:MAG: TIGR01212 family radical SAM protein [Proteobacteria bacterium]|nr:TIGR01212 family radical SAM protein [Pseudomonadota bacterium]MBU1584735.1 TIGR01212 family radical SAM protein [Pseudomonadota bacterium]MBU2454431.1 TIGR01212 family radical SAM protein [Pseudomonadota bacterium]MBU2628810.1 TIGR01212 family radical SAM protein [Pseudomonadota bacterium]
MDKKKRYSDYNTYLRQLFGQRVQKISVDAGLSCPNRDGLLSKKGCIYCNSKGSGSGMFAKGLSIKKQIETGKIGMIKKYKAKKFLAYFQSYSNTYTTCEHMKQLYDEALSCDGMVGMAIGTRPDCINTEKLDLIESYAKQYLVWLEYGLQSVHDTTLDLINRGHGFKDFMDAVQLTAGRGINICTHIILGLPGEDKKMMLESAKILADTPINGIKIHLLYVIKGTLLEQLWKSGEYIPMEQAEYVETVCDFLELLPKKIIIQRITGDPHPDELRAPLWAGRYRETFNMIQQTLEKRNSFQGSRYKK